MVMTLTDRSLSQFVKRIVSIKTMCPLTQNQTHYVSDKTTALIPAICMMMFLLCLNYSARLLIRVSKFNLIKCWSLQITEKNYLRNC